jgi:ribosome-associated protein
VDDIKINRSLTIPGAELELRFSPSGGPGGQHANKTATRAELTWNVNESQILGPRQRQRLQAALRHRIDSAGNLRLTSDRSRSQMQNRNDAIERFADLVRGALRPTKQRVETKPSRASKEKRLEQKKKRSETKQNRRVGLGDF